MKSGVYLLKYNHIQKTIIYKSTIIFFSRILFIIWNEGIRAYSTTTGEWIRDLEGATDKIISQQCDPVNSKHLYACTINGEVISWKWKSGVINERQKLVFQHKNALVQTFSLVVMKDNRSYGLVTWRNGGTSKVDVGVFDLSSGQQQEVKIPLKLG